MDDPLRLANLRASRTVPAPDDRDELSALRAAAARAGRRLVDIHVSEGRLELIMGWVQDNALTPNDPGGPIGPSEGAVLALAACVRACWPDPDEPIYPGEATTVSEVRRALEPLGVKGITQALNRLRVCGFLALGSGDDSVRLGPEIALWRDADIASLRREYQQLPTGKDEP